MTCPGCGNEDTKVTNTYPGKAVERRLRCKVCGGRWKTKERTVRGSFVIGAIANSKPRAISSNTNSNQPISSSLSDQTPESDPNSQSSPLSNQTRARVRAIAGPSYEPEYLPIWAATDKRGDKFKGQKAWISRGRPPLEIVQPKWKQYRASLESWRNPKDLSTWLNNWGHTHEYTPAAPEPARKAPVSAAVAVEMGRSQRALEVRTKRWQAELSPAPKPPDPRQEYVRSIGGQK